MLNINTKIHTNTTIVSLLNAMKKASIYGRINVEELYVLNTVYKLLNTMCLDLTHIQRKQLISIYNKLAFKSNEVCTDILLKGFQQPMKNKFTQHFVNPECIDKNININYWKTTMYESVEDIIDNISKEFLNNTLSQTKEVFNEGHEVSLQGIGRFAFFVNTQNSTNIQILDSLNNDVTHTFDLVYIQQLNGVLIVSDLLYTSTPMFFKIITNG